jgi:hypothetical protein
VSFLGFLLQKGGFTRQAINLLIFSIIVAARIRFIKKEILFDKASIPSELLGIALFKYVFGLLFLTKGLACKTALLQQEPLIGYASSQQGSERTTCPVTVTRIFSP